MTLYHYTCEHGHAAIQAETPTMLRPNRVLGWLWLTDLDAPSRYALGLTSHTLHCDRTRFRYRADAPLGVAHHWVDVRREFEPNVRHVLEQAPGAMPMHWWVAWEPIPAVYDPILPTRSTAS